MTKRRYSKSPSLPPIKRQSDSPPFVRRCPSGEYEVMYQGLMLATGFETFKEASDWIAERRA